MEAMVDIGLNQFIRLRKLRVEHLTSPDARTSGIFHRFLEQLATNQTILLIKMERVFNEDPAMRRALYETI